MLRANTLREKLQFLRGNSRLVLLWPVLAVLFAAFAWAFLLQELDYEKNTRELAASNQSELLAKGYANHLFRLIEDIDRLTRHVRYDWTQRDGKAMLEDAAKQGLLPEAAFFYVGVLDRSGALLSSSSPAAKEDYLGDKRYFVAQQRSHSDQLYIGGPQQVGPAHDEEVLFFSRKLMDPLGRFAGVVYVAVAPSYFMASEGNYLFGPYSVLAMLGDDGILRAVASARVTGGDTTTTFNATPRFAPQTSGNILLNGPQWFTDRRSRFVGWHRVEPYGQTAVVGLDEEATLEPFFTRRAQLLHMAYWSSFALGVFALIATALSLRLAWRKHQIDLMHQTYRMATEGGTEGFYIACPLHDDARKVRDFKVIDCNKIGARMFQLRREEMIGMTIASLYDKADSSTMSSVLQRALVSGGFEGEVEVPADSPLDIRWAHVKIVRTENNELAITLRDISGTKAHVAELERRTNEDVLTRLPNRHWLQQHLPKAIERAHAASTSLALLFIDLDGFKAVNDSLGHAAGDEVLRTAARRLQEAVRPHDCVVRLAGDEFVVLLDRFKFKKDVEHVAQRILHAFDNDFRLDSGTRSVGVSIGISVFPDDGRSGDMLLQNADIAMYSVKTSGKHGYRFFDQRFYDALRARLQWEYELRAAVERDEFIVYYQPRVETATGKLCSMEALVRWQHPKRGMVPPAEFIPLAEETGLILPLGELVAEKVCQQLSHWENEGKTPHLVPVSVNVSSRQFNETNVAQTLADALRRYRLRAELLEIELTESSMMGDSIQVARNLNIIQAMGVKLLVDDFGTGYSSLSQLQLLDFDVLKVDKSFTARLEVNEAGIVFYRAIITMAHALGMRVVAEGVETEGQVAILKELGCDELQGFYISKPLSAQNINITPSGGFRH